MSVFRQLMMRNKIPAIYKVLDWIEGTGTQYINTNYFLQSNNLKANIKFEFDFDTSAERDLIGNQDSATNRFIVGTFSHYIFGYSRNSSGQDSNVITANFSGKQIIELEANYDYTNSTKTLVANGVTTTNSYVRSIYPSNNNIQVFGAGTEQSGIFVGKIYYCQIFDNGTLVRNMIPVRRLTDNVLGMYDTVSKTFFGNAGTGSFIGSDEILLTKVGSPTITDGVVSGFSSSNYLYKSNFPYTKNWSITIKATTTSTGETQRCLYRSVNFQLRVNTINTWEIYASGVNKSLGQSSALYPYVRVEKENGYISAYISQDGITYLKVAENIDAGSVTDGTLTFSSDGAIWSGSIDLNKSFLVLDGTKYIFTL